MSTIVFAGPSVFGVDLSAYRIDVRPPARCGDLLAAVHNGAETIGLIDGLYGDCAAVWHKEILYALSRGIRVYGAASMGALRAAECSSFGMEGVGHIFEAYRDGDRFSDGDVAVSHAPAELDYRPLSVALVDAQATIAAVANAFSVGEVDALLEAAAKIHFSARTWRSIVTAAGLADRHLHTLRSGFVSVKCQDAQALLAILERSDRTPTRSPNWRFQNTLFFEALFERSSSRSNSR